MRLRLDRQSVPHWRHVLLHWSSRGTAAVMLAGVGACSGLTKVVAPDLTQPSALQNGAGAATRGAGAVAQFYNDMSTAAFQSGFLTDELMDAANSSDNLDMRVLPDPFPSSIFGTGRPTEFGPQTRVNALTAIALLQRYSPTPPARIGELFAILGTIETVLAEDMCAGVPLATVANGVPVAGSPTTSVQLYAHALAQFDSAARYAADSARILNWAVIGRARVLLDLDSAAAAAVAVRAVPTGYVYQAQYSATINQPNLIGQQFATGGITTVSDREGINGLNFVSARDPRVPTASLGIGADGVTPAYSFTPYSSAAAPMTIASGIEARLMEAEAALASGDPSGWLTDLNALRADSADTHVTGLGPIADPIAPASRVDTMFTERAFWLFLTGHRQGDLRRLIRQYGRTQDHVFPIGPYKNTGQQYGSDVTFPLTGENLNQGARECLNRDA